MRKLISDKKGLSVVVTTLILLVVSVLIAGSVTYYTTNVTQARSQEENLQIRQAQLWVNSTGSTGAIVIKNVGGKDVAISSITVGGKQITWNGIYLERASAVDGITDVSADLNVTKASMTSTATTISVTVNGAARTFTQQTGKFTLKSAETVVIYFNTPSSLSVSDLSRSVTVSVTTTQNSYTQETNVKSAS